MKKKQEQEGKLSIKKFQITKIKNPQIIVGGNGPNDDDTGNTQKRKK